mmetsp:Transcript_26081/g.66193  ORF Transcript_26081/g.66193 Transcript_26081/m.66193 type:complete len:137 (+) Transcript_26081:1235-1645(+)
MRSLSSLFFLSFLNSKGQRQVIGYLVERQRDSKAFKCLRCLAADRRKLSAVECLYVDEEWTSGWVVKGGRQMMDGVCVCVFEIRDAFDSSSARACRRQGEREAHLVKGWRFGVATLMYASTHHNHHNAKALKFSSK